MIGFSRLCLILPKGTDPVLHLPSGLPVMPSNRTKGFNLDHEGRNDVLRAAFTLLTRSCKITCQRACAALWC